MKNLNREKSNIIKSGDSANLNIFNQMPYVFTRTEDYVVIEHAIDGLLITTRSSATVKRITSTITISGESLSLSCPTTDIGTIDGVTPADANQAALLLGKLFKGYSPIKITIE